MYIYNLCWKKYIFTLKIETLSLESDINNYIDFYSAKINFSMYFCFVSNIIYRRYIEFLY